MESTGSCSAVLAAPARSRWLRIKRPTGSRGTRPTISRSIGALDLKTPEPGPSWPALADTVTPAGRIPRTICRGIPVSAEFAAERKPNIHETDTHRRLRVVYRLIHAR